MKRILSMILALVMVLTCLPALPLEAHAATVKSGKCGDDLRWTLSSEGTLTISGTGDMYDYKAEEAPWYQYGYLYSGLHTLKIMDGVTSIGDFAFYGCSKIQNVIIADSVTEIGGWAFSNCSGVTTVTIPKSVTSIGEQAFSINKNLTSIVIPDSVTNIGSLAFYECTALTNVTLPNTITNMGNSVFSGCSSLTSIDFFTNVFTTILPGTFRNCTSLKTIKIPNSITSIGYAAFDGCTGLASVTIPNSVTDICDQAFRGCTGIKEMTIPQSVTSLGNAAFCGCTGLTSVTIPNSIKEIGYTTFYNCTGLTSVTIPDSVKTIGDNAFEHCTSLTAVEIGNSVTKIGGSAFRYCSNLKKVTIPNSVTDIGGSAFLDCSNLTSVTIPNSVTNLGWGVFRGCTRLREITFKGNAPSFGNEVFTSVTAKAYYPGINDTWTESVRQNYGGKITWIPVVSVIASGTCGPNLTWVLTEDGVLTISGTGEMTHFGSALEVPWHNYRDMINRVVIEYGATGIGPYAFSYCRNMTSVEIPNSVAFIYQTAFGDCSSLQSVNIPDSVTSIGFNAFALCTSLTSVTIPKSVTWIGNSAFHGCTSLTKIKVDSANTEYSSDDYGVLFNKNKTTLISCPGGRTGEYTVPASVKSIGESAFAYCKGLTSVKIGDNVDSVGNSVFYECRSLSSVILGGSIPTISDSMFFYCDSLTSVEIPASVSVVGSYAFGHCYNLQRITFTGNAPSFGDHGFYGVTATAYYPANNTTWTEEVRQDYGGKITWAPTYAIIASGICGDNLTWVLTEDGTLAISGTGEMYGYNVSTGNYAPWYDHRESIKTVVIETGATSIGSYAFSYCRNMTSVEIPDSVTGIGISAFYDCSSLTSVSIPDSVISIGAEAFFSCDNLASVSIGNSVESIGEYAFGCCSNLTGIWVSTGNPNFSSDQYGVLFDRYKSTLIQVPGGITGSYVIPDGVISIGDCAASFCDNLTSVSIPDTVISIGDGAFECCTGLTSVSIGNSVESIGLQAFYFCMGLTSVSIPDSVTSIGENAFYYCPVLKEISFEGSAPAIGNNAFYDVTATAYYHPDESWTEDVRQNYGGTITWVARERVSEDLEFTLSDDGTYYSVTGIGTCKDTDIIIPGTHLGKPVKAIGVGAFVDNTNITSVKIPDSVTSIGLLAFGKCTALTGIWASEGNANYSSDDTGVLFNKNKTELIQAPGGISGSYTIPDSVTSIGAFAFTRCIGLTSVRIGSSVETIGDGAFSDCTGLTGELIIPDGVARIENSAFYRCFGLTSVTIPASVTSIGQFSIGECTALQEICFDGSAPTISANSFYNVTATAYYHPDESWTEDVRQNYGGTITWVAYTTGPAIIASGICGDNLTWVLTEDGTLTISGTGEMYGYTNDSTGNYAPWYNYRESIKAVVIEAGATSIGSYAFYNCGNMTRVEIPDSVTAMRYSAFNACAGLPGVEIPNSVSYIGSHAFKNCTSLASVEISNSVTELISGTFYGCTSLTNVVIPDSVTNIGWSAFYGCTSLTSVVIPDSVTHIAADAFYNCKALKRVEIPASVTSIYNNPFAYCTSLTEIKVDEQNPNYSSDQYGVLFDKNQTLLIACPGGKTTAYEIPDSVTSIGEAAFQGCMGLPSVHIPRSVADIGNSAFWYATKLKEITFEGNAPDFGNNYVFSGVKATAYYPANDPSWTEEVRQNYGGTITWVPYCIGECIYTTVVTAPTCTQYGYTTYTCACGDSYVSDYTSPLGHDYKYTSTTEPTCTKDGYDLYTCSRCSANKKQILSATGHHFGDDNVCDNCGFTIPEDHQHSYTEKVVPPTCTTGGYTEHTCSCGHSYRDNYKEQTGHSWDDGVVTKEPSCTAEGIMTHTCNTCGETIVFVIEPGHDWDETVTKEATCTEDGVATRVCKLCGEEETIVLPAGHKWNEGVVTKEPTCTEKGIKTVTCTVCGTTEEQEIPELGHNFYNGVCTRCGAKIPDIITPDTEHPDYGMYFLVDDIRSNYGTELINEYGVYLDHNPDARIEKVGIYLTQEGNLWRRCIACVGEGITYATYVPYLSYGSDIKYTGLNSGDINIYRLAKNDKGIWCYNDYTTIGVNLTDWRGNLLLSLYDIGQAGAKTRIFDDLEAMKRWLAGEPEHTCSHTAVVTAPTCTADGFTTYTCSCGDTYTADPVTKLGHDMGSWVVTTDPTCTVDGQQRRDCSRCDHFETETIKTQGHKHTAVVTAPTCTADGFTTYTCSCGDTYTANPVTMLGHDWGQWYEVIAATPYRDGQQRRDCSRCDHFETQSVSYQGNALKLPNPEFAGYNTVWIEGLPYAIQGQGDERYVIPPAQEVFYMVTYTYYAGDGQDVHTQYPTGMKVYKVSKGEITYIPELDDLLQYSGSSIRIVGKKGIRMITSLTKDNKKALTGKGLAGFKLLEYGTALCFASEIQEGDGLVLGRDFTRSNFAYKKGEADPVFASPGNLIQYTNVLVGFSLDQCKEDIAMRPYIILEDAQGNQVTLYGGTIYRSIGYIAYQNRSVFKPKTAAYNYVWELIHHVYGDKYDADFKG